MHNSSILGDRAKRRFEIGDEIVTSPAVAQEKMESQVRPTGVTGIVSSCPFCYFNLKEGAEEAEEGKIGVYDLVELLVRSMEEPQDA